jgi:hypothetical protein
MALRQSVLSKQYIRYAVSATVNGVVINPTADVVEFAFTTTGTDPLSGDWKTGSWETVTAAPSQFIARFLLGPGGTFTLAKGSYSIWIRITDSPEVVVISAGIIDIF